MSTEKERMVREKDGCGREGGEMVEVVLVTTKYSPIPFVATKSEPAAKSAAGRRSALILKAISKKWSRMSGEGRRGDAGFSEVIVVTTAIPLGLQARRWRRARLSTLS